MCSQVIAQLPQMLKSTFFGKTILHSTGVQDPPGPFRSKKKLKMLILAFEANVALSCQIGVFSGF